MNFNLSELKQLRDQDATAAEVLYRQMGHEPTDTMSAHIQKIIDSPHSQLLVARNDSDQLIGMITINLVFKVADVEARIDHVVVDEAARGHGIGEALMRRAVELCWKEGADKIELTSRPDRAAANHLYQKLGFKVRETNVYQLKREN